MDDQQQQESPIEAERRESFSSSAPAELDLTIGAGRLSVRLTESTTVDVWVRADLAMAGGWAQGLSDLLGWIGEATGSPGSTGSTLGADLAAQAVEAVEIAWSEVGRRLVVRPPTALPLRAVPLVIDVGAPVGSRVRVQSGSAPVTITGSAGGVQVKSGSGEVRVDSVEGDVDITSGSGAITVGPVTGRAQLRSGSGRVSIDAVGGPSEVKAGSGKVRLGTVLADLGARTGSGDLTVADARGGRLELSTGSGGLRVGVHAGVIAELDLSSGSGRARSELPVGFDPPEELPTLVIRGRSGTGDVLVTRAVS